MRLTGKIVSRAQHPWSKPAEAGKQASSGTVHELTVRDADTDELVTVASFVVPLDEMGTFALDSSFDEAVRVAGMFRGAAQLRLVAEAEYAELAKPADRIAG